MHVTIIITLIIIIAFFQLVLTIDFSQKVRLNHENLLGLNNAARNLGKPSHFTVPQYSKNDIYTLVTSSSYKETVDENGNNVLILRSVASYIFYGFTLTVVNTIDYTNGNITDLKTESFTNKNENINFALEESKVSRSSCARNSRATIDNPCLTTKASATTPRTTKIITTKTTLKTTTTSLTGSPSVKISSILPYGIENGDISLPIFDDDSFGPIALDKTLKFNSSSFNSLYICSNGFVSNTNITMFAFLDLNLINTPIIGPLLYDLKNYGNGSLFYRQTTNPSVLTQIKNTITSVYPSRYSAVSLNWAFIVTWKDISLYNYRSTKNTFQLVLTSDNNCQSFVLFQYEKLSLPEEVHYKAGYTRGDSIFYQSITNIVQKFFNITSFMPRSVVYPLNLSPSCT